MIILEDALILDPSVNHPVIGAFPVQGVVVATSAAPGFDAAFAADPSTIKFWRPGVLPAHWTLTTSAAAPVSYVGLAVHDLGSRGVTVLVQIPDGAGWQTIATHSPEDDSPILFLLAERAVAAVRLRFTGTAVPTIGIIMIGRATTFPQKAPYVGRQDIFDQVNEDYSTNLSEGGNFIARYITRRSQTFNLTVSHLSECWKASTLDPLIAHLRGTVAFIADRPHSAPRSIGFGQLASRPVPEREIPQGRASVTVSMDFIGHVS